MGHGRDVKDATKQEAVLDRRQYVVVVGEAKAVDFFFFLGDSGPTEAWGSAPRWAARIFRKRFGVVVSQSILRLWTEPPSAAM